MSSSSYRISSVLSIIGVPSQPVEFTLPDYIMDEINCSSSSSVKPTPRTSKASRPVARSTRNKNHPKESEMFEKDSNGDVIAPIVLRFKLKGSSPSCQMLGQRSEEKQEPPMSPVSPARHPLVLRIKLADLTPPPTEEFGSSLDRDIRRNRKRRAAEMSPDSSIFDSSDDDSFDFMSDSPMKKKSTRVSSVTSSPGTVPNVEESVPRRVFSPMAPGIEEKALHELYISEFKRKSIMESTMNDDGTFIFDFVRPLMDVFDQSADALRRLDFTEYNIFNAAVIAGVYECGARLGLKIPTDLPTTSATVQPQQNLQVPSSSHLQYPSATVSQSSTLPFSNVQTQFQLSQTSFVPQQLNQYPMVPQLLPTSMSV